MPLLDENTRKEIYKVNKCLKPSARLVISYPSIKEYLLLENSDKSVIGNLLKVEDAINCVIHWILVDSKKQNLSDDSTKTLEENGKNIVDSLNQLKTLVGDQIIETLKNKETDIDKAVEKGRWSNKFENIMTTILEFLWKIISFIPKQIIEFCDCGKVRNQEIN